MSDFSTQTVENKGGVRSGQRTRNVASVEREALPLGINTKIASPVLTKWARQAGAKNLLPVEHRINECCIKPIRYGAPVELWTKPGEFAAYHKLRRCGSVWVCAVCSAKIAVARRAELHKAVDAWTDFKHPLYMVTFTLQHNKDDSLIALKTVLRAALREVRSGKAYQDKKRAWGILGAFTGIEITYGQNGWHIHAHQILFLDHQVTKNSLQDWFYRQWISALEKHDRYASRKNGVMVSDQTDQRIGDYVTKWGLESEATMSNWKTSGDSVTPWGLLDASMYGDKQAAELWQEYAYATKGLNRASWSSGLKRLFGMVDITDQEVAENLDSGVDLALLALIPLEHWRVILANDARGEVLEWAKMGGLVKLNEFIKTLGLSELKGVG